MPKRKESELTPPAVVARLSEVVVAAVRAPDLRGRLMTLGLQPTGTSASEFAKIQKSDTELWAPVIQASGFKPE